MIQSNLLDFLFSVKKKKKILIVFIWAGNLRLETIFFYLVKVLLTYLVCCPWNMMFTVFMFFFPQALESLTIATFLLGVIPLLLGMLFELVIVVPLRVPIDQTPLYFPWQVSIHPSQLMGGVFIDFYSCFMLPVH